MPPDPLDIEQPDALAAYLRDAGRIGGDETVRIRTLAGGVSNKTVLVERPSGEAWVLKQALSKLRVAVDWFSDPARIHREALGLKCLAELAPAGTITPLIFEDAGHHLLAMEAVPQPHENWKAMLLAGRVEMGHVEQFAAILGQIHRASWDRRDELAAVFDDRSFFESLRIEPYYAYTATQVPEAAGFLGQLIADTRGRRLSLVHGDYSPKNVLVHGGRLVLLDHEVIHWGDPAFDLGFSLAHLFSKAHYLPELRSAFAGAIAVLSMCYWDDLGPTPWRETLGRHVVRHTLGCLLARVAGRSPLEYLNAGQRERQRSAVLALMRTPPPTVQEMYEAFIAGIIGV